MSTDAVRIRLWRNFLSARITGETSQVQAVSRNDRVCPVMCERIHTHDHHSPPLSQSPQAQIFHKRHGIYTHVLDVAVETRRTCRGVKIAHLSSRPETPEYFRIPGSSSSRIYTHSRIRDSYAKARGIARLIGSSRELFGFPDVLRILLREINSRFRGAGGEHGGEKYLTEHLPMLLQDYLRRSSSPPIIRAGRRGNFTRLC